jgi:hypothetical protein
MDAQTQARIFEPFFTTKEKGKAAKSSSCAAWTEHAHGHVFTGTWVKPCSKSSATVDLHPVSVDGLHARSAQRRGKLLPWGFRFGRAERSWL